MPEKFEPKIKIGNDTVEEKKSSINKIIGVESEVERQEIEDEFAKMFKEQEFEDLKQLKEIEIEKTPRQIEIINLVNGQINGLLEKYDLPKFNIPANNVHLLKEKDYYKYIEKINRKNYKKLKEQNDHYAGQYFAGHQSIFINNGDNRLSAKDNLEFANVAYHEFIHSKAFQSFQNLEKNIISYQTGLSLDLKSGKKLFDNLNEGLTEELEKRFYHNVLKKHPLFSKKIQENEKIIEQNQKKIYSDDIFAVKNIKNKSSIHKKNKNTERIYFGFGYIEERKILNTLIEKLYSKNKDKFEDKEQVFDLFVKSAFTGKLNWGGLVNRTFGKGTFKKLAHLDENVEEMAKFVDDL